MSYNKRVFGTTEERFWPKVERRGKDECWYWLAYKHPNGYGQMGRLGYAHRISFAIHNGPIPKGKVVDHICHNRSCVNPDHLRLATHFENAQNKTHGRARFNGGTLKGAFYDSTRLKWRAAITHDGHQKNLGRFDTEQDAHEAYCDAADKLFGRFSNHGSR